ncbi:MAG: hypothetical protein R8G34_19390 [Paracoccaceae bacterium]|nr:hypothetical protein [Paracoccaceae bacterium]
MNIFDFYRREIEFAGLAASHVQGKRTAEQPMHGVASDQAGPVEQTVKWRRQFTAQERSVSL